VGKLLSIKPNNVVDAQEQQSRRQVNVGKKAILQAH